MKRTAFVTGANKGLGFEIARQLCSLGIVVFIGARSIEAGIEAQSALRAEGGECHFVELDVTSQSLIDEAFKTIGAISCRLDLLINNAGIMLDMAPDFSALPPSQVSPDSIRTMFETNCIGVIAMTRAALPLLRNASSARVINVASRLGSFELMTHPDWSDKVPRLIGYGSSKAAMNFATICLAEELAETPIKINAVSPGTLITDLSGVPATDLAARPGFTTPQAGAELILKYAFLPEDGPTGSFFGPDGEVPW
jgi:NAD(P)-dependent dehydrogenase (short-subunit alcohol dehydrogenase family)